MAGHPLKDQWRYVKLPITDEDRNPKPRHLKVLAVGKITVVFGTPEKGDPSRIEIVGTYYIKAVTWL